MEAPVDHRAQRLKAERWLRAQCAIAKRPLHVASMLGVIAGLLVIPQAWLFSSAVSPIVVGTGSFGQSLPWLLALLPLFLARFALGHGADVFAIRASGEIKAVTRRAVWHKLMALGPSHAQEKSTGALATTVIDGVDTLDPYYERYVPHMGAALVVPLAVALFVFVQDWISGLVLLFTGPVIPVFMMLIGYGTEKLNQRQWRKLTQLSGRLLDSLQRLATIKVFNAGDREAAVIERASEDYRRSTMSVLRMAFLSSLSLEFFATVGVAVVAVLVGFRLLYGQLDFATGFLALLLAPEFYAPLRRLGSDYHARMEAIAGSEPLIEILSAETAPRGEERPDLSGGITIACEKVSFSYVADKPALQDVDLTIRPKGITAIIGGSGAGKSTLLSLILGQRVPSSGRILINGHDLATIDPDYWLRQVAVIPQRPHIFAGSILDNITLGRDDLTPDQVRAAAEKAGAAGFIEVLPHRYDTPLGERGQTLSGGQVQRVALARLFLKDAPVILMDEPTTGLDAETEEAISRSVAELARERTVMIIAHRLRTIRMADHVVVMDEGRVIEQGPFGMLSGGDTRLARLLADAGVQP